MDKWLEFDKFYNQLLTEVYHEPDSFLTTEVVDKMLPGFLNLLPKDASILDLGCGAGYALTKMRELGYENVEGLTFDKDDAVSVEERGFKVHQVDFNFTGWESKWDAVWMRHVLEHSPFPFFTIYQLNKMIKPGGILYVEMPKPEGSPRNLEHWPNHYSIMGVPMYKSLFERAGFFLAENKTTSISFSQNDKEVTEVYDWYLLQKQSEIKFNG